MSNNLEWVNQSKVMFKTVNDPEYLLCDNFNGCVYKKVFTQFFNTKISKTDFSVLNALIEYFWITEESLFKFNGYDNFLILSGLSLSKPNLSRALKTLEEAEFISLMDKSKSTYTYKFLSAFEELKDLT